MIAADTSSLVAYFAGDSGDDISKLILALKNGDLVLPPVVVTELLSDKAAAPALDAEISLMEILEVRQGYWVRAGHARRTLQEKQLSAKIADALIAQSCIDNNVALITRDQDFRHFAKYCGLKLA